MTSSHRTSASRAIRTVHLISKTHLDIGFTDQVNTVIDLYLKRFLPRAAQMNQRLIELGREERFVWTTGSWIISEALKRGDAADRRVLEEGILSGALTWHALPFTTRTEYLTDSLLRTALKMSQLLDRQFGRTTIVAKLTDVPGHTRALVPILQDAGVELLHVGVNGGVVPPDVPKLFTWQDKGTTSNITVLYDGDYGGYSAPPGSDVALDLWVTGDNDGPPTLLQLVDRLMRLKRQHPDALVRASSLNEFAADIRSIRGGLKVVESEIGDNWIYGTGSDPQKTADFRALSRLHSRWATADSADPDIDHFAQKLILVGEHT